MGDIPKYKNIMLPKTPVSILQETMCRDGIPPKYELIYDGTGTHVATFKIRVSARNESAIGTGTSKKEAKQEVAKLLLEKLALHQPISAPSPAALEEAASDIDTSLTGEFQNNPIGYLQNMCVSHKLPMPEYKVINEKGESHSKTFSISCVIRNLKTAGFGTNKKHAKKLAAIKMINAVKQSLGELLKEIEEDKKNKDTKSNIGEAVAKYKAAVGPPAKKMRLDEGILKYLNFFSDTSEELIEKGRGVFMKLKLTLPLLENKSSINVDTKWVEILKEVTDAMEIPYDVIPCNNYNKGECAFISLSHKFNAVFYGVGSNVDCAISNAALSGLQFIHGQLM